MKGHHVGELEELVLLTVGSLYENAYAVAILNVIKENLPNSTIVKID